MMIVALSHCFCLFWLFVAYFASISNARLFLSHSLLEPTMATWRQVSVWNRGCSNFLWCQSVEILSEKEKQEQTLANTTCVTQVCFSGTVCAISLSPKPDWEKNSEVKKIEFLLSMMMVVVMVVVLLWPSFVVQMFWGCNNLSRHSSIISTETKTNQPTGETL